MFNHTKIKNSIEIKPENKFHSVVKCECSRSDRLKKPFSLIVFRIDDKAELITLTNFLGNRIRMSDQIGWFDKRNLGILLPETSHDGAVKLTEEIKRTMDSIFEPFVCQIYYYPSLEWEFDKLIKK